MPGLGNTGFYRPYVLWDSSLVYTPPTFTVIAPTSGAASAGSVAVTLTGTFMTAANGVQYTLLVDGQSECILTVTNATTATGTIKTNPTTAGPGANRVAGAHTCSVIDSQGQRSVTQTFTIT